MTKEQQAEQEKPLQEPVVEVVTEMAEAVAVLPAVVPKVVVPKVTRPKIQREIPPEIILEPQPEIPPSIAIQPEAKATVEVEASHPATPPLPDPRRRLRELLAIPDRERTDALWDELIELEIQLAPGNRALPPGTEPGRNPKQPARFTNPGRRQDSPGAPRHNNRPHDNASGGGNGAAHGAPNANGAAGTPGAPRPGKRFFKKARRGPRPPG